MYINTEQAKLYSGTVGQQAFAELGFDSLGYIKMIKDDITETTAAVLYSAIGMMITVAPNIETVQGLALQHNIELLSVH
jgi:hypothetical protein